MEQGLTPTRRPLYYRQSVQGGYLGRQAGGFETSTPEGAGAYHRQTSIAEQATLFIVPSTLSYLTDASLPTDERLLKAAAEGQLKGVEDLIYNGVNLNATDECGNTALHLAAKNDHLAVVRELASALIDNGENLNATNECGNTALHLAAKKGHSNVIKCLLENEADIRENENDRSPLHLAAEMGKVDSIIHLQLHGPMANLEATDKLGMTPLDLAAEKGHLEVVKELISQSAEVARPKRGEEEGVKKKLRMNTVERETTALHCAVKAGHADVVKYLVENGNGTEALEMWDRQYNTPLDLALTYDDASNPDKATTIREESVKALCQRKTNPNLEAKDKNKDNVLIWAVKHGQLETVKAIVKIRDENGGRVNLDQTTDTELNRTALMMAINTNQTAIVQELLNGDGDEDGNGGANPSVRDKEKTRPLMLAVQRRNKEVVEMLLKKRVSLGNKKDGHTALHMALNDADIDIEIVRLLVQNSSKADLMATDHIERTYLHCAALRNNAEAVTALAERAKALEMRTEDLIEAEDTGEKRPLHIAAQMGNLEAVRALINAGVVLDYEDIDENMPIDLASENGYDQVETELDRAMAAAGLRR